MKSIVGMITIGQSPRSDVVPDMVEILGPGVEIRERGALDGLSPREIAALAPAPDDDLLVTRLADGSSVFVAKRHMVARVQALIDELETGGVTMTALLCTGAFPRFRSRREWWRSCAGSEPGAARGHAPRAARPASRGLLQRSPRLDARDQLHARVLRPDLVAAHPPAVHALLLRQLLPGRALGHAGPGRHHHGRRPPHGISARLAPRPHDEPLEAGAPRLRALPAPRGH